MTDHSGEAPIDQYLNHLKASRDSSAVLKMKIAKVRSSLPNVAIFAFEGDDDKIVYSQWISRLRPGFVYEPFPCKGKSGVKQLKAVLARDLGGLSANTYFFVDRDFDDLDGFVNAINVFMTDMYSVENYLVSDTVLEQILKTDFPCHAAPDIRSDIRLLFARVYKDFLDVTREVNRRIFISRRLRIELKQKLPKRLRSFASISLRSATAPEISSDRLVAYTRELKWTPSVGQESGQLKRESRRVATPLPIRGDI